MKTIELTELECQAIAKLLELFRRIKWRMPAYMEKFGMTRYNDDSDGTYGLTQLGKALNEPSLEDKFK